MSKVSILIFVYNEIRFIRRTLESVIQEADEILISDYGSTDGTLEVLKEFSTKYPKIIYAIYNDLSHVDRWSWLFQNAHGKYIRLIGGHDMVSSGSSKSMAALLDNNPDTVMVYSKYCIYLNSDYTLNNFIEMPDQWCENLCSEDPFARTDSAIEHICEHIYHGMYRIELLKQYFNSNIIFPTDLALHLYMASKGKMLFDGTSFFFWMLPRKRLDTVSEFIRIAKASSNEKSEHPFYFAFAVVLDSYNLAIEMQKLPNAPTDFGKKILFHWLNYLARCHLLDKKIILEEMPQVTSGNEKIRNEVYAMITEYQKNPSDAKIVNNPLNIKKLIKKGIKCMLPYGVVKLLKAVHAPPPLEKNNVTYSQVGEDAIISFLLALYGKKQIKYLDIGTNDPVKFNNTYKFYLAGSYGVCVEANVAFIPSIKKMRPKDTIINVGVSTSGNCMADFYMFDSDASGLNTLDKENAEWIDSQGVHKIERVTKIPLITINDLIKNNFSTYPDFLSIDIEGLDLAVLKTLDFTAYPIPIVCVETCGYSANHIHQKDRMVIDFMLTKNYEIYADTRINTIFVNKDWFYKGEL
jgi:glycosyltransferase involved in cell wall biosynthesis